MEGPRILWNISMLGGFPITETILNTWIVMLFIFILSKYLTHDMQKVPKGKQALIEKAIIVLDNLVEQTMGKKNLRFAPYICALFLFSAISSLSSLFTLRPPTSDLNVTLGWAIITFIMVQYNAIKTKGLKSHLKGFLDPVPVMLPLNLISEVANPISMSFRHFGNIAAGMVITSLLYGALASLSTVISNFVFGRETIALLQIGLPAVLSIYFDLFTALLQAFIFCMLTMVFVSIATEE